MLKFSFFTRFPHLKSCLVPSIPFYGVVDRSISKLPEILEYQHLPIQRKSMYPKVKLVTQEEEDPPRVYLKPLSLYDHPSAEHKDGYTPPYVRVPISSSGKVNRKAAESNSKAASVLPPRAVLSSPENDAMHGTKNKKTQGLGFKNHNLCQNTHVKCTKSYQLQKRTHSWK